MIWSARGSSGLAIVVDLAADGGLPSAVMSLALTNTSDRTLEIVDVTPVSR